MNDEAQSGHSLTFSSSFFIYIFFRRILMRKTVFALLAICAVLLMLINGAACSRLSPDHIKANDHLQKGNENYNKELYKKAIL